VMNNGCGARGGYAGGQSGRGSREGGSRRVGTPPAPNKGVARAVSAHATHPPRCKANRQGEGAHQVAGQALRHGGAGLEVGRGHVGGGHERLEGLLKQHFMKCARAGVGCGCGWERRSGGARRSRCFSADGPGLLASRLWNARRKHARRPPFRRPCWRQQTHRGGGGDDDGAGGGGVLGDLFGIGCRLRGSRSSAYSWRLSGRW
jgi:hypothetical protein